LRFVTVAVFAMAFAWSWPVVPAHAQDDFDVGEAPPVDPELPQKIKKWNAECLACHSEQGIRNPPRQGMDLAKLAGLLIPPERFEQAPHGSMACKECHGANFEEYPHVPNSRPLIKACASCHQSVANANLTDLQQTAHYKNHPNFTCTSCHNSHTFRKAAKIRMPRAIAAQDNAMCRDCHESDVRYAQFSTEPRPMLADVHAWLPNPLMHWKAVRCIDCHTPATPDGAVSHLLLPKAKAERNCVTCHSADSALTTRLYRYLASQPVEAPGFLNAFVLSQAYVVAVTRNAWLDYGSFIIFGLLVVVLLGHGLLRFAGHLLRRGRTS
jgi:predicted CXXCH cytochrome family protein